MKINELSAITGVNTETIRMYRTKKLLNPRQLPNGYYDYSLIDLQNLLYIRKLRSSGLGLDVVNYTYTHNDQGQIIRFLQHEKEELEQQLQQIRQRIDLLNYTIYHFRTIQSDENAVAVVNVPLQSYVISLRQAIASPDGREWLQNMEHMIQCILPVSREADCLRTEPAIMIYEPNLLSSGLTLPKGVKRVSMGSYLSSWITLDDNTVMPMEQLQPLLDYADQNGYHIGTDMISFLYRIDKTGPNPRFVYRMALRVENK